MQDRELRVGTDTPVDVQIGAAVRHSGLVNLSSGGALLANMRGLLADMQVTIRHGSLNLPARIMWCRNGVAGVRFMTPLSRTELQRLRGGGEWRMAS